MRRLVAFLGRDHLAKRSVTGASPASGCICPSMYSRRARFFIVLVARRSPAAVHLLPEPLEHVVLDTDGDPGLSAAAFGSALHASRLSEVVVPLHRLPSYCLRSVRVGFARRDPPFRHRFATRTPSTSRRSSASIAQCSQSRFSCWVAVRHRLITISSSQRCLRVREVKGPCYAQLCGCSSRACPIQSRCEVYAQIVRSPRLARMPPNKALQLTSHSVLRSCRGTVWRRTLALRSSRGGAVARS